VAAHLSADYIENNEGVSVIEDDEESWIRIGGAPSDPKLTSFDAEEFMYVTNPYDSAITIGYEGCWKVPGFDIMDNYIEVHFVTNTDDTVSDTT